MLTFVAVVGGVVLLVGLIGVVYLSGRRNKQDETGRRTEAAARTSAQRTEGRET